MNDRTPFVSTSELAAFVGAVVAVALLIRWSPRDSLDIIGFATPTLISILTLLRVQRVYEAVRAKNENGLTPAGTAADPVHTTIDNTEDAPVPVTDATANG